MRLKIASSFGFSRSDLGQAAIASRYPTQRARMFLAHGFRPLIPLNGRSCALTAGILGEGRDIAPLFSSTRLPTF